MSLNGEIIGPVMVHTEPAPGFALTRVENRAKPSPGPKIFT